MLTLLKENCNSDWCALHRQADDIYDDKVLSEYIYNIL